MEALHLYLIDEKGEEAWLSGSSYSLDGFMAVCLVSPTKHSYKSWTKYS